MVPDLAAPTEAELASLVLTAPMMAGAEYLTPDVLRALWAADGDGAGAVRWQRRKPICRAS